MTDFRDIEFDQKAGLNTLAVLLGRRKIGIVFQDPVGSLNPRLTVSDIISEGLSTDKKLSDEDRVQDSLPFIRTLTTL